MKSISSIQSAPCVQPTAFSPLINEKDILGNILSFMPVKDVLTMSCTCKEWHKIANGNQVWVQLFHTTMRARFPNYKIDQSKSIKEQFQLLHLIKSNLDSGTFEIKKSYYEKIHIDKIVLVPNDDKAIFSHFTSNSSSISIWDLKAMSCNTITTTGSSLDFILTNKNQLAVAIWPLEEDETLQSSISFYDLNFNLKQAYELGMDAVSDMIYHDDKLILTQNLIRDSISMQIFDLKDGTYQDDPFNIDQIYASLLIPSNNGNYEEDVLVIGASGAIDLIGLRSGKIIAHLNVFENDDDSILDRVIAIVYDQARNQLISLSHDRSGASDYMNGFKLQIWNLENFKLVYDKKIVEEKDRCSMTLLDDQLILVVCDNSTLIRLDLKNHTYHEEQPKKPIISHLDDEAPTKKIKFDDQPAKIKRVVAGSLPGELIVATKEGIEIRDYNLQPKVETGLKPNFESILGGQITFPYSLLENGQKLFKYSE